MRATLAIVALVAACDSYPDEVTISGRVLDARSDDGAGVGGVTLSLRDETEQVYATATAEDDGAFAIPSPSGSVFWLSVEDASRVGTSFDGYTGFMDLEAEAGQIWSAAPGDLTSLRADFSACTEVNAAGGVLAGEVRLYIPGNDAEDLPLVSTAWIEVRDEDGALYAPCYLDDEGLSDEDAELTGATGRFAAFGLPAGRLTVTVQYTVGDNRSDAWDRDVWMLEDGFVPLYPMWVELVE